MSKKKKNELVTIEMVPVKDQFDHTEWVMEVDSLNPNHDPNSLESLLKEYGTKSAVIRYLTSKGWSRGAIARFMGIRYQHVRNVLENPPKKQ